MVGQLPKINAVFPTQKSVKNNAEVTKKFVNDFLVEKMAFIFDNWPTQKFKHLFKYRFFPEIRQKIGPIS